MEDILIGTTDRTILVFIPDPASTTGAGKTGLAAADLTVTYTRVETDNDVVHTDVTSSLSDLSALTDAHSDWGLKEVSATLSKGLYRLDVADAVFASGAWYAVVQVTITSGTAAATPKAFRLIDTSSAQIGVNLVNVGGSAIASASGVLAVNPTQINGSASAAAQLAKSAVTIVSGTVDTGSFTPTTTQFEADDITEATADHYNGRSIIFTSGALQNQATTITDYVLSGSNGKFTVEALTEAPANDVTFLIV